MAELLIGDCSDESDDKMDEIAKHPFYSELFVRIGHHYKISSVLLLQNNCASSKYTSTINKNCHYTILTRSPRNMYITLQHIISIGNE